MKHSDYRKLRSFWGRVLADSGFVDIETPTGELKTFSSKLATRYNSERLAYYLACYAHLENGTFESETHRLIWELHASGNSSRQISLALLKRQIRLSHVSVRRIIRKIERELFN